MAALSENMLIVMLLSVFFLPGVLESCSSHLFITTPKKMEAPIGSCLWIPCSFSSESGFASFDSSKETFGLWIKDGSNVVFNSRMSNNPYPMKIGNLNKRNCATLFFDLQMSYAHKYFFRIENGPYKATDVCKPLHITVKG
ncbi:hypothetical protein CHARACLAT_029956 [Characodon lateralis]|uniref:Uncharacterized protein n=1 Tax=Characodon lateralis TaxID=208331 RepID=A0ABU7EYJ3_9TELE|nr:hypothetical protein [Characodon lateralis]